MFFDLPDNIEIVILIYFYTILFLNLFYELKAKFISILL